MVETLGFLRCSSSLKGFCFFSAVFHLKFVVVVFFCCTFNPKTSGLHATLTCGIGVSISVFPWAEEGTTTLCCAHFMKLFLFYYFFFLKSHTATPEAKTD